MIDINTIGIGMDTSGLVKGQRALKDTEMAAHKTADAADKAGSRGSRGFKQYGDAAAMAERQTRVLADTSATASRLMGAALVGLGAGQLISMTDQYTKYTAQLKLATGSTQEYANANVEVQRIAKATEAGLASTGVLFARITNATRELGVSQSQVSKITETVGLSLKVAGASAAESASAQLQLSQAFGAGALRGEEFNAVNEAAPGLMRLLAASLGVAQGALKKMAEEGKLTSDVLVRAFGDDVALAKLRSQGEQINTVAGAYQRLRDQMVLFVGDQDKASGASAVLISGINLLAENLNGLTAVALGFGATKFAEVILRAGVETQKAAVGTVAYVAAQQAQKASSIAAAQAEVARSEAMLGQVAATKTAILLTREETLAKLALARSDMAAAQSAMASSAAAGAQSFALRILKDATNDLAAAEARRAAMVAELALLGQQQARVSAQITAATAAQTAAQSALTAATGVGGAAAGMASRAMGLLGGPIGLIATALGLGATAWALWGNNTSKGVAQAKQSVMESSAVILAELDKQIERNERLIAMQMQGVSFAKAQANERHTAKLAELGQDVAAINSGAGRYSQMNETEKYFERLAVMKEISDISAKMQRANASDERAKSFKQEATDLIEVRMRLAGINKSYFEDLEKYQKALAAGAISEAEYIKGVSELATETYKSSKAGKDASKGATAAGMIDKSQVAQDLKTFQSQIAQERQIYGDRNGFLQKYFAAGLISEEEYYRGRAVSQQEYLDAAKGYYAEEVSALEDYIARAKPKDRIDAQTKLNDLLARQNEMMREMAGASASDEIDRISKRTVAVMAYTKALEDQLRTQRDANTLAVAGVGRGDLENNLNARVFDVRREFDKQQRDLATQLTGPNAISQKEYDEKLALLKQYQQNAVQVVLEGDSQIRAAQDDWTNGATRAIENYRDSVANIALQTEGFFTNTFKSMEDAIVQFAMTGKLSFKSLADSIIAELVRIQAKKMVASMSGGIGNVLGSIIGAMSGSGSPYYSGGAAGSTWTSGFDLNAKGNAFLNGQHVTAFANGGAFTNSLATSPTLAPMALFGEAGPEAIMPLTRTPDGSLGVRSQGGNGGGKVFNVSPTYNVKIDGSTDMARNQEMIRSAVEAGNAELVDRLQRAGAI